MSHLSSRRQFLAGASAGATALTLAASSYARVVGANDRISIGVIGCGVRGLGPTCRAFTHMPRAKTSKSRRWLIHGRCPANERRPRSNSGAGDRHERWLRTETYWH